MNQLQLQGIVMGIQNAIGTLEADLVVSQKIKQMFPYDLAISHVGIHLPERNKDICLNKKQFTKLHKIYL